MLRTTLAAVLVLVAALTLPACEEKITASNFTRVTQGMTRAEVERILGKGELQETGGMSVSGAGVASGAASNSLSTYTWRKGPKEISVTFGAGDKVVGTSKSGF